MPFSSQKLQISKMENHLLKKCIVCESILLSRKQRSIRKHSLCFVCCRETFLFGQIRNQHLSAELPSLLMIFLDHFNLKLIFNFDLDSTRSLIHFKVTAFSSRLHCKTMGKARQWSLVFATTIVCLNVKIRMICCAHI